MIFTPEEQTLAQVLEIYRKRVSDLEKSYELAKEDAEIAHSARERAENGIKNLDAQIGRLNKQFTEKEEQIGKLRSANQSLHIELQAEREAHQKLKDEKEVGE